MKNRHLQTTLALLAGLASVLSAAAVQAQLEEIVVTAERREASVQDVPASVTAITADTLEEKLITNVRDLQVQVPNLNIATNTGTASAARIFLRGIGEDESRGAVDQAVAIYVDDVFIGRSVGSLMDLVDLERIEVLRGPQGTLYGRNSNGGAIRLVSKAPSTEGNDFEIGATVGSDSRFDGRLMGNLAISDATALRFSFLSRNRDGFHTLIPNGDFAGQGGNVGEIKTNAIRLALRHDFNDRWSMNLSVDRTEDDSDPIPDSIKPPNDQDNNQFTIEPAPGVVCAAPVSAFTPTGCFTGYSSSVETQGVGLSIVGDLGNYTFKSLTGSRSMEDALSSRIGLVYSQATDQDQLSQEFSLSSNYDGAFNWVAGLYYFDEEVQLDSTFLFDFSVNVQTTAIAAFAHGKYDLTDALTLTAGLRYTDEERDVVASNVTLDGGTGLFSAVHPLTYSKTTYNLALDYAFSDAVMVYGSYSTGFKSGGASPDCFSPTACFLPVDEEEVDTFEIGLRSDLADNRLRLNLTYFFNTYEGLQIGATTSLGFTRFNVDETEISGIEAEAIFQPTENLSITANFGWLDGEYTKVTDFQAGGLTNGGGACPGGVATVACALALELKNAPEFKGTVGFLYNMPLGGGNLSFGADASFEDDSWSLVANAPPHVLTEVDTLINARVAYEQADRKWMIALWGKNLTDEEYARAGTAGAFNVYASEPLTWGVDGIFRF